MVEAGVSELIENTLAARPVGASNTTRCLSLFIVRTMAPDRDVLPVPADPRIIITALSSLSDINEANVTRARLWSRVGSKPKLWRIWYISSSCSTYFDVLFLIFMQSY